MTANIDLAGTTFTTAVIAPDTDMATADFQGTMFSGTFDGNGYTISNLAINAGATGNDCLGLFGCISETAIVKNLAVENVNISGTGGSDDCGGIVGWNRGIVQASHSSGSISGQAFLGGLIGRGISGNIMRCYSSANVAGTSSNIGGLVGTNSAGSTIQESYATGNAAGCYVGGLVGVSSGSISNSYATGNVTLTLLDCIGGFIGYQGGGSISKCYSAGHVSGAHNAGGFIGFCAAGTTTASFWDTQTSGKTTSAGGTGKTTTLMKTLSTFTSAGWDFVGETTNGTNDYWQMLANGYPLLAFQPVSSGAVATPVFAPGAGTYNIEQNVIVTCATAGVTIHYTTNGVDPTEADPVVVSGSSVLVDHSLTLKAKVWKIGIEPSNVASADYVMILAYPYSGGSGTPADPYQIATKADLLALASIILDYGKSFILTADIDLAGTVFTTAVIAPDTDTATADFQGTMFSGTFDGNGYAISNLAINAGATGNDCLGLFGCISETAIVKNLAVENVSISGAGGSDDCGGIVGWNRGIVQASHSSGSISGQAFLGGLIGRGISGNIMRCYSSANVAGTSSNIGGLVGTNSAGSTIQESYATGNAAGCYVGGLVGVSSGSISNSYATGNVTLTLLDCIGGLVGYQNGGSISKCYSTGYINGLHNAGGFIGFYVTGTTAASFWDTQTSGMNSSAGGTGKTTAQMQTLSTFIGAGWDFVGETTNGTNDYWYMPAGSYPLLAFQPFTADFVVVAKRRVGRTIFDYDCKVTLKNYSTQSVRVTQFELTGVPANVSIIDAFVSDFGDIGAGGSATGTDTCTFRVDRSQAITASQVTWQVAYEVLGTGQTMQLSSLSELDLEPKVLGDITGDKTVDYADLMLLVDQWLSSPGDPSADIAPDGGDGIVNFQDYAVLAGHWMEGR
jgi:hypothetical protein